MRIEWRELKFRTIFFLSLFWFKGISALVLYGYSGHLKDFSVGYALNVHIQFRFAYPRVVAGICACVHPSYQYLI